MLYFGTYSYKSQSNAVFGLQEHRKSQELLHQGYSCRLLGSNCICNNNNSSIDITIYYIYIK